MDSGAALAGDNRTGLEVVDLVRRYSHEISIGPVSFAVGNGEFFSLLGPSGCGKTTTLRCVAGFEQADSGTITLDGVRIEGMPPQRRSIGLVFQTPALFPHLTVAENVAFGLQTHKVPRNAIANRVEGILSLINLSHLGDRMPNQLSGGQQQRVALARSLVLEPPLLLLDEPFSSLDLKLRVHMRDELRILQKRLRKTTIFVTHDQTEALALSDRIAVMSDGRIEQIGTPEEVYRSPASVFVADFIGSSNLLRAEIVGFADGFINVKTSSGLVLKASRSRAVLRDRATLLIRPECIQIRPGPKIAGVNNFSATLADVTHLGADIQYHFVAEAVEKLLCVQKTGDSRSAPLSQGPFHIFIDPGDVCVLEH